MSNENETLPPPRDAERCAKPEDITTQKSKEVVVPVVPPVPAPQVIKQVTEPVAKLPAKPIVMSKLQKVYIESRWQNDSVKQIAEDVQLPEALVQTKVDELRKEAQKVTVPTVKPVNKDGVTVMTREASEEGDLLHQTQATNSPSRVKDGRVHIINPSKPCN